MSARHELTVVCGGGGLWGAAWMIGVVTGLLEAGVDIRGAGVFIGTSAGSVVASQLTSVLSIDELFAIHADPARQPLLMAPPAGTLEAMTETMRRPTQGEDERLRAIRAIAMEAPPMRSEDRRDEIVRRLGLPALEWPDKCLLITAMDLLTGELTVFSAGGDVSLLDAVSASTAVPGVWPAAEIGGRTYVDGGVWRTAENAHLAAGAKRVLILSPLGMIAGSTLGGSGGLVSDVAALKRQGADVVVVSAGGSALAAMAPNPLDPATRKSAAEAGLAQGSRLAQDVRAIV